MNIFCPFCGGQADDSWAFCPKCGNSLDSVRAMKTEEAKPVVNAEPAAMGFGFGVPDLGSFDLLGDMANSCLERDLAQQEADALAAFEVEKHQNGKYAILALKDKSEMDVVVPSGVEAIGPGAFEGSDVLTVALPEGLLKIGDRAFANCVDLDGINFPKSLRVIGNEAFAGCVNLDVEAPEGVRLGVDVFKGTALERRMKGAEERAVREAKEARERDAEYCYQQGKNCDCDDDDYDEAAVAEAVNWYRKAADLGHIEACYQLGLNYEFMADNSDGDSDALMAEAVSWYRKAAELGHAEACYELGGYYYYNEDEGDYAEWYRKAAELGHENAGSKLAMCYARGDGGVAQNFDEAERWAAGRDYLLKEIRKLKEDAEEGDEVEFDNRSEIFSIGEPMDVVLIDGSENDGVEVTFRGFEVNELLPGKFVHLMVFEVWNPRGKDYSLGVSQLDVKGGEAGVGWDWHTKPESERHNINMYSVVRGFDPEGKYRIFGTVRCRVAGKSTEFAEFKATVDFDEELQACYLYE